MATMAQLNVRMTPELKAAGDSVLDLYDVSPSELIRALWEKISLGETAFRQVVSALTQEPAAGTATRIQKEEHVIGPGEWAEWRFNLFAQEVGLDPSTFVPSTGEELEDLLYEDYLEKEAERGY